MARLRGTGVRFLPALAAILALSACDPVLDLRTLVEERVTLSQVSLVLYDGSTIIGPGDTVTWPDTIFGDPAPKTLTLKNTGTSNVTLTGPNVVSITGGAGAASYGGIVQPVTTTLIPGASTTFNATFTPVAPDNTYVCDFVINSNDGLNPAYVFHGTGRGTQWHGSSRIVYSASSAFYYSPQISIAPASVWQSPNLPTLIAAYYTTSGIFLSISKDGGKTWPSPKLAISNTGVTAVSIGVSSGMTSNIHIFYLSTTPSSALFYTIANTSTLVNSTSPDYTSHFATNYVGSFPNSHFYQVKNSNIAFANNKVYLAYYNSAASKLQVALRDDTTPTMGIPAFSYYDVTGINGQTGDDFVSLQVDATKLYALYGDGQYTRVAVLPLATIGTPGTYLYYTINNNGAGRSLWSSGLVIDGTKGYALWRLNTGSPLYSAVSTNMSLSSWSSIHTITGETTATIAAAQTTPLRLANGVLYTIFFRSSPSYGVRFASSSDEGVSWSPQWLDVDSSFIGSASEVALAVSGSTVYAAYTTQSATHPNDYSITLKKSLDGGNTW